MRFQFWNFQVTRLLKRRKKKHLGNVWIGNHQPREQFSLENLIFHLYFNFKWFFGVIYYKKIRMALLVWNKAKKSHVQIQSSIIQWIYFHLIHLLNKERERETLLCLNLLFSSIFTTCSSTHLLTIMKKTWQIHFLLSFFSLKMLLLFRLWNDEIERKEWKKQNKIKTFSHLFMV